MKISTSIVNELLYEDESPTLDFKVEKYKFEGASNYEKGELLKDILAFANSWRRTDAYIMIGVRDKKGSKSEVIGIDKHIDDAILQQFVNSKTQRPIFFSYQAINYDGKQIGLIHIPLQERPIYLKKDYGGLKNNVVYIRRGSATDIAEPDEVTKMGIPSGINDKDLPALNIQFANAEENALLGDSIDISTSILTVSKDSVIPNYGGQSVGPFSINLGTDNIDYYRELAKYLKTMTSVTSLNFAVTNSGRMVAHNVRIEVLIKGIPESIFLMGEDDLPSKPVKSRFDVIGNMRSFGVPLDIHIKRNPTSWFVSIDLDKIQPKREVYTESNLYIGASYSFVSELECRIYADNLSDPFVKKLEIDFKPEYQTLTVEQLILRSQAL